jgi:carbohydrate-selective porin OprB
VNAFGREYPSSFSLWGAVEQAFFSNEKKEMGILVHGGLAPSSKNDCRYYYAVGLFFEGLLTKQKKDQLGFYYNGSEITGIKEQTLEITWQYQVTNTLVIQPAYHCIRTGGCIKNVGLFRVIFFLST